MGEEHIKCLQHVNITVTIVAQLKLISMHLCTLVKYEWRVHVFGFSKYIATEYYKKKVFSVYTF